ncbi:hypothetical protein Ari01nite_38920 [Paractinoplanes rishiriensis]|uniref:Uncharacterized protein n=1 Tax=Paractinoplanes rishiriensis TaxID=1050105 RepID=A0A919N1A7_9ACTN|nr:hypothetical protein Ari01nite_38920 [Actinoplanes rishiriensis]
MLGGADAGRAGAAAGVLPGTAPLPFVTIGTLAEPFAAGLAAPGPAGRFASDEPSLSAGGSLGGGVIPGARVNFGGDGASAGAAERPADSRPFEAAPSFLAASSGVVEPPEVPDFACVSGIN